LITLALATLRTTALRIAALGRTILAVLRSLRRLVAGLAAGAESTSHWNLTSAFFPNPRAQSAAFIIFLPGG